MPGFPRLQGHSSSCPFMTCSYMQGQLGSLGGLHMLPLPIASSHNSSSVAAISGTSLQVAGGAGVSCRLALGSSELLPWEMLGQSQLQLLFRGPFDVSFFQNEKGVWQNFACLGLQKCFLLPWLQDPFTYRFK